MWKLFPFVMLKNDVLAFDARFRFNTLTVAIPFAVTLEVIGIVAIIFE